MAQGGRSTILPADDVVFKSLAHLQRYLELIVNWPRKEMQRREP
jgi:hypothetical protein